MGSVLGVGVAVGFCFGFLVSLRRVAGGGPGEDENTMKAVDNITLARWREMDAIVGLRFFADHIKQDHSYHPTTSRQTSRWHVHVAGCDWEMLCTGPKFWDTRSECGGGGAIDMIMHLYRLSFKAAVALLKEKGL